METQKRVNTTNSTFSNMIKAGHLYVDKSKYVYNLVSGENTQFFLSRPRRMGKTLTVSTLESVFQGRKELFKGLYIYGTDYDWKQYPVIHIDFGDCGESTPMRLDRWLNEQLSIIAKKYEVSEALQEGDSCDNNFRRLVSALSEKGQVVILIDEYDKVLSDNIFNPEVDAMREVLGNFYQVIKTKEASVRFAFITGVTKYAKLSVFSRMNNLTDLSMRKDYATMLGYTKGEFLENFSGYIERGIARTGMTKEAYLAKIKAMYDGYRFHPRAETVYNPVSVGQFFSSGGADFFGFWADTGNTKLLMDIARRVDFNALTDIDLTMDYSQMKNFDVLSLSPSRDTKGCKEDDEEPKTDLLTAIDLMSLLYQTGYLTLVVPEEDDGLLHFDFPNTEVRESFTSSLLTAYTISANARLMPLRMNALSALRLGKTAKAMGCVREMLSAVPYTIQIGEEKYYQSLLYMMFCSWGARRISAEETTNIGRIDLALEEDRHLYVIECKYGKDGKKALGQIKEKRYAEKYLDRKGLKEIHLLGIDFSPEERNIDSWEEESL